MDPIPSREFVYIKMEISLKEHILFHYYNIISELSGLLKGTFQSILNEMSRIISILEKEFVREFQKAFGGQHSNEASTSNDTGPCVEEESEEGSADEGEQDSEDEHDFDYSNYLERNNVVYLYDQVFEDLRSECLKKKKLFRDPKFPTSKASFYKDYDSMKPRVVYTWLRPGEISDSPSLVSDGASRFDTKQGAIGNCWFVSAVSNFAHLQDREKGMFTQVVPDDQGFGENYAGIFHFRFWQYGQWVEVVVDDRLPTKYGQLACLSSMDNDEYWAALLEKAYAKLHGSYEALSAGDGSEAFVDLTGALSEIYKSPYPDNLYQEMLDAYEKNAFIGCIYPDTEAVVESVTEDGLVTNHYYSVTAVKRIDYSFLGDKGTASMVRVRNPWANETEWKGPGSDESEEWNFISQDMKDTLDLKVEADGEFWMPFNDFCEKFDRIEICHKPPHEEDPSCWFACDSHGTWPACADAKKGDESTDDDEAVILKELHEKPQYTVKVDDDDTTIIVQLIEKNRRRKRLEDQTVEIFIFKGSDVIIDENDDYLEDILIKKSNYGRDVSCEITLDAGTYTVIPANSDRQNEREYYMRIIYNNSVTVRT